MHRGSMVLAAGLLATTAALGLTACTHADATGDPGATSGVQTPTTITRPSTRPTSSASASAAPDTVDPVVQHVYDLCAPHALSKDGATLTAPVPGNPSGPAVSDGLVSVTFAIASFADGHTVGTAKYLCAVSNGTTTSALVSGTLINPQ